MIGILHHSPLTVSVLLDRERFKPEFISEADVAAGLWEDKVSDFLRSSRDNRIRVLFVEKLSSLQAMLADGLETDGFKVAIYDDCDVLKAVPGIDFADAGIEGAVWKTYQLLPERLNEVLCTTDHGVPEEAAEFDPSSAEEPLPLAARSTPPVPEGGSDSATLEMRQADAVVQNIIKGGKAPESPPAPPSEADAEEEVDELPEAPPEPRDESEDPSEAAPDPVPDPPPPAPKAKKKVAKKKVAKKKAAKKKKKKAKKLESRRLF
jgi:hypothetical protein